MPRKITQQEKQEPGKTLLRHYPWKPFLAGLGAIGLATGGAYAGGQLLSHGLAHVPAAGAYFRNPANQAFLDKAMPLFISSLGAGAALTGMGLHLAHQQRLSELADKYKENLNKASKKTPPKVAHVLDVYQMAAERLR